MQTQECVPLKRDATPIAHGTELSGVETGRRDNEHWHERGSTLVDAARNQSDACGGRESEERAPSSSGHSRSLPQHHSQRRDAACRERRHRGRGIGRTRGRKSRREVPSRRRDHRAGRPEQQAHRRAESVAGTDVPAADLGPTRAGARGDQLRLRADSVEQEGRRRARRRLPVQGRARFRPHGEVPRGRRLAHGTVDSHPARHRRRTGTAARGKHAPQERAARALRFLEHPWHERPDAARVRAGVAGRANRHDRAYPRRVGHRQRADRAGHPLQLAAGEAAVHQGELRGAAGEPHRIGAVRLRKRARSPARTRRRRDASSSPRGARSFSTKSAS